MLVSKLLLEIIILVLSAVIIHSESKFKSRKVFWFGTFILLFSLFILWLDLIDINNSSLNILDDTNQLVGEFLEERIDQSAKYFKVYDETTGVITWFSESDAYIAEQYIPHIDQVYFTTIDCTGTPHALTLDISDTSNSYLVLSRTGDKYYKTRGLVDGRVFLSRLLFDVNSPQGKDAGCLPIEPLFGSTQVVLEEIVNLPKYQGPLCTVGILISYLNNVRSNNCKD